MVRRGDSSGVDPKAPVVNGRYRATESSIGLLSRGLLVIIGAEAIFRKEIAQLCRRGHVVGRLLVDVDVDPPVDHDAVRSEQWPSLILSRRW